MPRELSEQPPAPVGRGKAAPALPPAHRVKPGDLPALAEYPQLRQYLGDGWQYIRPEARRYIVDFLRREIADAQAALARVVGAGAAGG